MNRLRGPYSPPGCVTRNSLVLEFYKDSKGPGLLFRCREDEFDFLLERFEKWPDHPNKRRRMVREFIKNGYTKREDGLSRGQRSARATGVCRRTANEKHARRKEVSDETNIERPRH